MVELVLQGGGVCDGRSERCRLSGGIQVLFLVQLLTIVNIAGCDGSP